MYCLVPGCRNGTGNGKYQAAGTVIHTLPKDPVLAAKWVQAARRGDKVNPKNACVCSIHFKPDDYERDLKFELLNPGKTIMENPWRRLTKTAVPSLNIPGRDSKDRWASYVNILSHFMMSHQLASIISYNIGMNQQSIFVLYMCGKSKL